MKPAIADTVVRFDIVAASGSGWEDAEREIELKLMALPHPAMRWTCDLDYQPLAETHDGYTIWRISVTATHKEER